ncbi:unnamed protein product [Cuscuta epithymum]|uniref:Zinc-finger domain-containing protein n=3 Tax=Cuscuta epithymum TaxID=186058 RepID=A0AAV0E3T8_9ASTE|nr:unnamed protein product [Cuscuta epithymum]
MTRRRSLAANSAYEEASMAVHRGAKQTAGLRNTNTAKIVGSSTPLRRSNRLKGSGPLHGSWEGKQPCGDDCVVLDIHQPCIKMEEVKEKYAYEEIRKARILENQARMESLGIRKTMSELRCTIPSKPKLDKRKLIKSECSSSLLRRSNRLKNKPAVSIKLEDDEGYTARQPSSYAVARGCSRMVRGSVHDPIYGISCHFCRQKKLCGEEECKRCNDFDMNQPCIGKTDCSLCHSGTGVFCRACLEIRYGEDMDEVRANKEWICPHCVEDKGINPYWICNSSFCLKKRRMAPTGIAIYKAREMGFKSVAHLLMHELMSKDD